MFIDRADNLLRKIPLAGKYYIKNTARLKRTACLLLHKWNLLKPFSFVQWLVTYECNFFCPFCEVSAGKAAENELTTGEALALIDDLANLGVKRLVLSGGEPLVRRDLMDIMQHGNQKRISFGLVTNGYQVETLWDRLKQFDYFLLFTSIDGLPEYHDRTRKEDSFRRAMRSLDLFAELGVRTRMVNTVVHRENVGQLEKLYEIITSSAANRWHIAPIASKGRSADNSKYQLDHEILKDVLDFIRQHQRKDLPIDLAEACSYIGYFDGRPVGKPFFCGAGLTRCSVLPDGEVLGCHDVYDSRFSEGNIRDMAFSLIWKEKLSRFRDKRQIHESCADCDYIQGCQGGCWSEMTSHGSCLKSVWEQNT
jgi:radical SAM protein with 4Fe4S-binding SPASM domain